MKEWLMEIYKKHECPTTRKELFAIFQEINEAAELKELYERSAHYAYIEDLKKAWNDKAVA